MNLHSSYPLTIKVLFLQRGMRRLKSFDLSYSYMEQCPGVEFLRHK